MRLRHAFHVAVIAVLVTGLWAWSRGVTGPYHFDDRVTPLSDPASQSVAAWGQYLSRTLRPLTKLTYALEAETSITDTPAARRIVSIVLHSLSAGLLLLLIHRLAPGGAPLTVMFAALWFVHPVHADSVLLASGRTAVLSSLFVIAALLALDRSRRWLSALLFALACLSRETAFAALLPLGVLAITRHPGRWRSVLRELTPVLVAGVVVAAWIVTTPRYVHLAEYSMLGRPFLRSVTAQIGAVPVGLGLLFQPASLSIDYGIPLPTRVMEPLFLCGLLLYLAAAAGVVFFVRRGSHAAAVGLALWLAALLPTQSVIPKLDALANRPLSLALAGLVLASAPMAAAIARRRSAAAALCATMTLVAVLATASAVLVNTTSHRSALFQSELRLWQDAASKSRVNERPHVQYALLLKQAGQDHAAREALLTAATINPFSSHIATLTRVFRESRR